mgnify:CR=1 FL=1
MNPDVGTASLEKVLVIPILGVVGGEQLTDRNFQGEGKLVGRR